MIERRAFTGDTSAVPEARRYVVELLPTVSHERRQEIALMVSELATNCVRHAATGFTVTVQVDDGSLRVEVADDGTGRPRVKSPEPTELSGRGLRIVQDLADSFGIRDGHGAGGSTVWFVVRLDDGSIADVARTVGASSGQDAATSPAVGGGDGAGSTGRPRPRRRDRGPGRPPTGGRRPSARSWAQRV
ncbi:MAG TPA: ATP-binding protein [Acidimicrobiia bacterium]|jgi:anti-sigma regulatory factor (Ser/Thr protein kinase)